MFSINHELLISASIQTIYDALTSERGLSNWWTRSELLTENVIRFHFGPDYFKEMEIVRQSPTEINWSCIAATEEWIGTTVSFKLKSASKPEILQTNPEIIGQFKQNESNSTLLLFSHDNWQKQTQMLAECNYTWAMFLRSLKSYCETGIGKPFPNQHK